MKEIEEKIKSLELPESYKKNTLFFIKEIQVTYPGTLVSIYLYGPIVRGDFIEGVTGVNLLVIIDPLDIFKLELVIKHSNFFIKSNIIPRFLTRKQVLSSLDVFAVDFYDIQKNSLFLYGEDILNNKEIKAKDLVWQLERDTKAMSMRLIQALWKNIDNLRILKETILLNLRDILRMLRVTLDLKKVSYSSKDVLLDKVTELMGIDRAALNRLLDFNLKKNKLDKKLAVYLCQDMFNIITKLDEYYDTWNQ